MNTLRFLIALGVILCLVLSPVIALMPTNNAQAQPAGSQWAMFGHYVQREARAFYGPPAFAVPELKWSFQTGDVVHSSPAIGPDGTVYVGSDDGNLYAINPDGSLNWTFNTASPVGRPGAPIDSSPNIDLSGIIYVGSDNGKLYAIKPVSGSEKWHFTTGDDVYSSPALIQSSTPSTICVGSNDGTLYGIDPAFGTAEFSFTIGAEIRSSPALKPESGRIYVGSDDGNLYAINFAGGEDWRFPTEGYVMSSPAWAPIFGTSFHTIYVGSSDGNLYAINDDGTEKWHFQTGGSITSSPAIGDDGTIYVGSHDGKLYAIGGLYTLTITSPPLTVPLPCGGPVTDPGWGTFTYARGTVVNLVAEFEEGCCFAFWSGDVDTIADVNNATTTITMNDNYHITPYFEECLPGGCFIATAAYGTPMAEEIEIPREFRDEYLLTNPVGQALTDLYYKVSPPVAEFITEHPSLKPIVRAGLLPAVAMSTIAVHTTWAEKMAIVGSLVLTSVAVTVWATRRRRRGSQYT